MMVPDLTEAREEWFPYWNQIEHGGSDSGELSQKQVVHALSRTFRQFDRQVIRNVVDELWTTFDPSGTGAIGADDLMQPNLGLLDTAHMQMLWNS